MKEISGKEIEVKENYYPSENSKNNESSDISSDDDDIPDSTKIIKKKIKSDKPSSE